MKKSKFPMKSKLGLGNSAPKSVASKSPKKIPNILLIGAGRFGQNHLRVLSELHDEEKINFLGVVVKTEKTKKQVKLKNPLLNVHTNLSLDLLKKADVVDIVTPPETHFQIVSKCLRYADVFVEKPLTENLKQSEILNKLAKKYKRRLAVGHIFRHDPLTKKVKEILGKKKMPKKISGNFINPIESFSDREPSLEFLHLFDIVDYIWNPYASVVHTRKDSDLISVIDVRYENVCDANYVLGWSGDSKVRKLNFKYDDFEIEADFSSRNILEKRGLDNTTSTISKVYNIPLEIDLIKYELLSFIEDNKYVDATTASNIVALAEKSIYKAKGKPSVAVIGAGIFGSNVACELAEFCDVTLFEKNPEIMNEATLVNCFRHHYGYHYPRSVETVKDIHSSKDDFESVYKGAIDYFPTYYGLAKKDSFVSKKQFIKFCKENSLPYEKVFPGNYVFNKSEIDLSIKVPEASYGHERLKAITLKRLNSLPGLKVLKNTKVTHGELLKNGKKVLSYIDKKGKTYKKTFDYIINATYADINRLSGLMNFSHHPIRVDLAEVVVLKLPVEPMSLTIIDGPFATLMSTGNPNEFTLYHVVESILDRYVPKKGLLKNKNVIKSNQKRILKESLKWFPVLKDAEIIGSRVVNRGVLANVEHSDARVADVINHGFGCWSILSGKILSSVSVAKRISNTIRASVKPSKNEKYRAHLPSRKNRK